MLAVSFVGPDPLADINRRREQMANERFLDMPSLKTILVAAVVIVVFLGVAYGLYQYHGGEQAVLA
jgi:hypothetical protein